MKIIKITESQYKRLVKSKNLKEQFDTVYKDYLDEFDITTSLQKFISWLTDEIGTKYGKNLYIDKIQNGIVYIDWEKYNPTEKKDIENLIDVWVEYTTDDNDSRLISGDYFSGLDWDYGDEEEIVVEPDEEDNDDVADEDEPEVVIDEPEGDIDYDITKRYSRSEYINLFKNIAINQMNKYNIPASITLAQGIIESGNGNSKLARNGKNHFGIKCHGWTGDKSYHDDDRPNECFRNYDKVEESYEDHSKFLKKNSRYDSLFELDVTDYEGWAKGLKKAGYATADDYANTLISIIESNDLGRFDKKNNNNDEEIIDSSIIEENSNLPNNFDKVPVGTNVFRSNQPSLSQLKYILNNYDIDTVVRMNGEEGTGVAPEDEKELVESMGKNYVFQNAHINEGGGFGHRGYETGKGYVGSLNEVQPILKQGNVLIHCTAGADRTGYQVGRFMKDNGFCGNPDTESCRKSLWDYTTKYNSWKKYIPEGREGYIRYMEAFYPYELWKEEIGKK